MIEYINFYKFREDPFGITPDPEFFFPSASHVEALESMDYFIRKGEGFMLITGGPGTGKTTLIRTFLKRFSKDIFPIVLYDSLLSPDDLLKGIIDKVLDTESIKTFSDRMSKIEVLTEGLKSKKSAGLKTVLILDEAQDLSDQTVTQIKHLSNIETEKEKLFHIILFAQPSFENILARHEYAQINQRISLKLRLANLDREGVENYIKFRLQRAGEVPVHFEGGAIKLIYKRSAGIPRLINLICSRSLMVGYVKSSYKIKKSFVKIALKHLHL